MIRRKTIWVCVAVLFVFTGSLMAADLLRTTQEVVEVISDGDPHLRATQVVIEVLAAAPTSSGQIMFISKHHGHNFLQDGIRGKWQMAV